VVSDRGVYVVAAGSCDWSLGIELNSLSVFAI